MICLVLSRTNKSLPEATKHPNLIHTNQDSRHEDEGKSLLRPSLGGVATSDWLRGEGISLCSIVNQLANTVNQVLRIVPLRRKDSEINREKERKIVDLLC